MTQMVVRTLFNSGETDPVRFLDILNRTLFDNVQRMGTDKNLTLSLLDYAKGEVRLSGQHEALIVMRLYEMVRQHWGQSAEAIKEEEVTDVRQHIGAYEVYDDITLVVVKQQ